MIRYRNQRHVGGFGATNELCRDSGNEAAHVARAFNLMLDEQQASLTYSASGFVNGDNWESEARRRDAAPEQTATASMLLLDHL